MVPDTDVVRFIGKEANRWEERSQTGDDPASQIKYGRSGGSRDALREAVRAACEACGVRAVARAAGLSHNVVLRFTRDSGQPDAGTANKLQQALSTLAATGDARRNVLEWAEAERERVGLHRLAERAGIDRANLRAALEGRRTASEVTLAKLEILKGLRESH